jgi:hypothetical protein
MFSRKLSNFLNLLAGLISIVQLLGKTVVHCLIQAYMIIAEYLRFGTNIFESSTLQKFSENGLLLTLQYFWQEHA